jgi:hypothetical protein
MGTILEFPVALGQELLLLQVQVRMHYNKRSVICMEQPLPRGRLVIRGTCLPN